MAHGFKNLLGTPIPMLSEQLVHERHTMLDERINVNTRTFKERSKNHPSRHLLRHDHQLVENRNEDVPLIQKLQIVLVHSKCQFASEEVELVKDDPVMHWQVEPENS